MPKQNAKANALPKRDPALQQKAKDIAELCMKMSGFAEEFELYHRTKAMKDAKRRKDWANRADMWELIAAFLEDAAFAFTEYDKDGEGLDCHAEEFLKMRETLKTSEVGRIIESGFAPGGDDVHDWLYHHRWSLILPSDREDLKANALEVR